MAIIATGSKTIIDLSDGKSLSVYLGANQPRTQIHDVNNSAYSPDWTTTAGKLVITPVVYANQTAIALSNSALTITWKRKEGSGSESALATGETVSGNILTVTQNKLSSITSGQLTYIAYVAYADPDTGLTINATADINFSLLTTGEDAKSAWISGEQVFKYDADGNVSPAQITLTANLQNVTMGKWQYKNSSGTWTDYPTTSDNASITGATLIVKPTHGIWVGETAALRITTSDSSIGDTTSIYKVQDGQDGGAGTPGKDSSIVFLTNENITFAGTYQGKVAAITKTCNVVAYTGTTKVTPTVGTPTGMPSGMTITVGSATDNEIPLTIAIAANSTLGGAGQLNGVVNVPITSPVETTLQIQWSKVNTGATGAAVYVLTLYAPGGTVFTNGLANDTDEITINAQYFYGTTDYTANTKAQFLWQKYESGSWTTVKVEATGANGNTLTVKAEDVAGSASYRCRARYNNGSVYSYDTITIIDKTDNYQAEIDSTAGDVFKNTVGQTCLICRLWQNGQEVDPLKSTTYSATAPSSPSSGDFYYQIQSSGAATKLMRYSGSAWADVTMDATYGHTKTYKWYRRDKDGNPMDSGAVFAEGKVIYVDGDDVTVKTVFVCEVE